MRRSLRTLRHAEQSDSRSHIWHRHHSRRGGSWRSPAPRKVYGIAIALTVIVLVAVVGLLYAGIRPAHHIALTFACPKAPTDTLVGVNATSPSQLSTRTAQFGHIPILRVYYTGMPDPDLWTTGVQGLNHSAVVVSFRSPPSTVLSGADDAALAKFFDSAPTGHPIYYSYYHEPELLVQAGTFTVAQYKAAWAHIAAIAAAAHNPDLKSTLILMSWDLNPSSGISWKDYLPAGNVISVLGWDAYPAGTVHDADPQPTSPADFMGAAEAASRAAGLPFGFAEFALGTQTDRPQWLAQVADYLRSTGALFGTLFDSTGFPWMELTDTPSIQAWRAVIGDAGGGSASTGPSPTPSPTASSVSASASADPLGPSISQASIDPAAFTPTGQNHLRILFKLSQPANVAVCVLDSQGVVQRELDHANDPAGWSSLWYFGYNTTGALLPAGTYTVVIAASNSSGSTTAQTKLTIGSGSSA
jgi:hypothetical protein